MGLIEDERSGGGRLWDGAGDVILLDYGDISGGIMDVIGTFRGEGKGGSGCRVAKRGFRIIEVGNVIMLDYGDIGGDIGVTFGLGLSLRNGKSCGGRELGCSPGESTG